MKPETAKLIASIIKVPCPLCDEKFRNKFNAHYHLKKEHTNLEAEKYLNTIVENNL